MPVQTIIVEAASPIEKVEEARSSMSQMPDVLAMNSNSLSTQTVLGTVSGLLTGYLDNAYGRVSAIGVGASMTLIRIIEHAYERFPVKNERLAKGKDQSVSFLRKMIDEIVLFIKNNMLLAVTYIGGVYGGHQLTDSA